MAKPEDTARQDTRTFLAYLRDALSQPPLDAGMATATISMVRLLAEQDTALDLSQGLEVGPLETLWLRVRAR